MTSAFSPIPMGRTISFALVAATLSGSTAIGEPPPPRPRTDIVARPPEHKTFYCDDRAGNNQVTVFSESSLEDFTAVCNRVAGECALDPQNVQSLIGKFSIRVEDLKTGMELRDHHMRQSDWLDAAKHPVITIEIASVEEVRKTAAMSSSLVLVGTCNMHGKSQPVRIPADLTYLEETAETMRRVKGDLLRIRANFDLKLADYGIMGPSGSDYIGLKVAPIVKIKVSVFGSTERPADPLKVDRPASSPSRPPEGRPQRPAEPPSRGR